MARQRTLGLFGNRKKKRHFSKGSISQHGAPRSGLRSLRVEPLEERALLSLTTLATGEMLFLSAGLHPSEVQIDASTNVDAADTTNTESIQPGGGLGLNLTGAGYTVGVWEAGGLIRDTHQEFGGRVTQQDSGSTSSHATHVAGTIAASGVDPDAEGMATQLDLWSYTSTNDIAEMNADAASIIASNHSYGLKAGWEVEDVGDLNSWLGISIPATTSGNIDVWLADFSTELEDPDFGKYTSDTQSLDQVLFDNPDLLSVWSAGNHRNDDYTNASFDNNYVTYFSADPGGIGWSTSGWYLVSDTAMTLPDPDGGATGFDVLSPDQNAKNSLVVGAVNDVTVDPYVSADITISDFSSYGPSDDGRIKPDVVGNGVSLYSADHDADDDYTWKSGTSMSAPNVTGTAALLTEHFDDEFSFAPSSATTKGVLIHTASDAGNMGPDYSYGWGLVNAAAAASFITSAVGGVSDSVDELSYGASEFTREVVATGQDLLKVDDGMDGSGRNTPRRWRGRNHFRACQ